MIKKTKYFISLLLIYFFPLVASAQNVKFDNPVPGFLIDLSQHGQTNTFPGLLTYLIQLALGVVGLLAIAFIIYGGFRYVTSGGNEELAETGKKTLTNAIIGLVIVILSYVIVAVIVNALNNKV